MSFELSSATHARLSAEMAELSGPFKVEIAKRIEEARALGDLSENGDYHAAKDEQGQKEARLNDVKGVLEGAVIVEPRNDGSIGVLSKVTIDWGGGREETFLVGNIEEKVAGGPDVLTTDSALGHALLDSKAGVGDSVSYLAPNGKTLTITVTKVA